MRQDDELDEDEQILERWRKSKPPQKAACSRQWGPSLATEFHSVFNGGQDVYRGRKFRPARTDDHPRFRG